MFSLIRDDVLSYRSRLGISKAPSSIGFITTALSYKMLPVTLIRLSTYLVDNNIPILPRIFQLINFLVYGIEVRPRCKIGGGFFLPHTSGTVIGARSIGRNCTIFQGVTIGATHADMFDNALIRPVIESDVTIGSGAKVLGPITVGSSTTIGANVVVTEDVPPSSFVVSAQPIFKIKISK